MAGPWRRTFFTLCAAQAMAMLAFGMALPFLPLYIQQLGIADPRDAARWAGVMSAAGMVVMATVAPVWGALADRHGRKSMVVRRSEERRVGKECRAGWERCEEAREQGQRQA